VKAEQLVAVPATVVGQRPDKAGLCKKPFLLPQKSLGKTCGNRPDLMPQAISASLNGLASPIWKKLS